MSIESYQSLVKELGIRLDFGAVTPNEDHLCILNFGETYLSLHYKEKSDLIEMYVYVIDVPEDCPKRVLERLLDAQCFFKESAGGTFSLCKATHNILLHLNLYMQMLNSDNFFIAVQNMLHTAEKFNAEIKGMLEDSTQENKNTENTFLHDPFALQV